MYNSDVNDFVHIYHYYGLTRQTCFQTTLIKHIFDSVTMYINFVHTHCILSKYSYLLGIKIISRYKFILTELNKQQKQHYKKHYIIVLLISLLSLVSLLSNTILTVYCVTSWGFMIYMDI